MLGCNTINIRQLIQQEKTRAIPEYCLQYIDIFDKKAAERFPPERPYDHAINLYPDAEIKDCPVYSLTPKELKALDEFLEENLRKGFIRPSKSPIASPFFFVPKKDPNDLRPCQDYRRLNAETIPDRGPLPIITDLLNGLSKMRYFTKLDLRAGYNNIRIKEGDQWKAAFKTPRGLFKPTVMFFGLCNSPATFQ